MLTQNAHILAIDDEDRWGDIKDYLKKSRWHLHTTRSPEKVRDIIIEKDIKLVLIDQHLEDVDYISLVLEIKNIAPIPVIILSKKEDKTETVIGLETGADDFINDPFTNRELAARIKANLRLAAEVKKDVLDGVDRETKDKDKLVNFGKWFLDQKKLQVLDQSKNVIDFTASEYQLLEIFALNPNRVFSREQLFEKTRQDEFDGFDRAVDVQIGRIRKKLSEDPKRPQFLKTIRGVGYMLETSSRP